MTISDIDIERIVRGIQIEKKEKRREKLNDIFKELSDKLRAKDDTDHYP